ncbi:MAG: carbohydrate binding family 9 domain-containing protein [Gemmatimonadaceae bacterium]|nr:carbohydrate binding family 9 domain-containing protein [Gemmatimonadaceae bacterium]
MSHRSSRRLLTTVAAALAPAVTPAARAQTPAPPTTATAAGAAVQQGTSFAGKATATAAMASRVTTPPVLDGRTDDPAWASAQVIDRFLEYDPNEGRESRFRTEVRVTYDDRYLYVLARMFDPAPDSIISLLSRRDVRTSSEQLKLMISSYNDKKTAYEFITNPAGVKRDFYVSNDNNEDASWDAVWDVATRIDSVGWVAEFRIPFSQMRYPPGDQHTFGLMIVRDIARTGQRDSWPLYHRNTQGYVSQSGTLDGIGRLPSPRRLELMPYTVVKSDTRDFGPGRSGGLARYDHPNKMTAGVDLKYGITSNLTLDATENPDFGQVEADPAQLNLTAFETFFEERRPFFLEGAGIFTFNTSCGDIDSGCTGLFYSRRIGRNPQLADLYGDPTSATATPIAAATKLTGRLANGFSIGLLDAVTQRVDGVTPLNGQLPSIEPRTNYGVLRLQRDHSDGQGDMGLMLTAVNRSLDPGGAPYLRDAAYTGGIDLRRRFFSNNYEVRSFVAMSDVHGTPAAIAALQTNTVHAYQRPDDGVAYDPTRTFLRGDAERISVSKFGGGITRFQSVYQRFSPGFESNDIGYQRRADEQLFRNWFALQFQTPTKLYQRAFFNFNAQERWTTEGLVLGNGLNHNSHIQWKNYMWTHLGFNVDELATAYDDRGARGGPAIRISPNQSFWAGIQSDSRPAVTGSVWWGGWRGDEGHSWNAYLQPQLDFRVSSRFSTSLGINYQRNADDKQFYARYGDVGSDTTHYTFARLDQTTVGISARLNFTATPNLSFQFYGEPFNTNGTYANWKELANPRAEAYADRFKSYKSGAPVFDGFNFRQFRSNTVLRYEYRQGSTLFVVWQQGRSNFLAPGDPGYMSDYKVTRDYDSPFRDHPNNTFLVKWSYWINP